MNERVVLARKRKGNAGEMGQLPADLQTGCVRSEGLRQHSLGRIHPGETCHRLKQGRHFCLAFPQLESGPLPAWTMIIHRRFVHISRCRRGKTKNEPVRARVATTRCSQQKGTLSYWPHPNSSARGFTRARMGVGVLRQARGLCA